METILETIKEHVRDALKNEEIIVDSVEYVQENNYNFLRIVLDKLNGIDLDTIVLATNIINPVLDKLDLISEEYILDVISKERGKNNEC